MKRLNQNYPASKVVNALTVNKNHPLIGAIVKFKNPTCTYEQNIFEIVGVQKIWDKTEAFRIMAVSCQDDFGKPAKENELEVLSTNN